MSESFENPIRDALVSLGTKAEALELPYLLVGGNALISYGIIRFTRDVDFLIPETATREWRAFLENAGYRCFHATPAFCQFESHTANLAPVDLMLVDSSTWTKLFAKAERKPITDTYSPHHPAGIHLIAMKLKASRNPLRRSDAQDWSDVVKLIRVLAIDLKEPEIGELIIRYGGDDALTRLKKDLS